jgi:hypothetical protein
VDFRKIQKASVDFIYIQQVSVDFKKD